MTKLSYLKQRFPFLKQWRLNFDLLRVLVKRDLEARYKGSVLGNLWSVINQLSQLLIYTYVFSIVLKVKLSMKGLPEENSLVFGLWLFAGLLPWIAFTTGLMQGAGAVISQTNLVKKVVFPLSLLPLVPILSAFIESGFGLIILIIFVALKIGTIHETLALLPLIWLPQLLFTVGLGYFSAALTVFFRDIPQTLLVIINLWFYATPIVYPIDVVPESVRDWILWLNPIAALTQVYRDLILVGSVDHGEEWAVFAIVSVLTFSGGFWVYQRLRAGFADVL